MIKAIQLKAIIIAFTISAMQQSLQAQEVSRELFIEQAVKTAQEIDPWLDGNRRFLWVLQIYQLIVFPLIRKA